MSKKVSQTGSPGRATLKDVADSAGVSRSTVSLVLRNSPLIAKKTHDRVQAAIKAVGYVYNRSAANLRTRRSGIVGLVICEISNPFFAEFTAGIDAVLDHAGLVSFLGNTAESPARQDRFIDRMQEHNAEGLILVPADATSSRLVQRLGVWGAPCVQALRYLTGRDEDYVGADYRLGMAMATEHLIGLGHRRIAFIGGTKRTSATAERHAGYRSALNRYGMNDDLIVYCPPVLSAGPPAISELLKRADPPTAAVCFNDLTAFGVMLGLSELGIRPGLEFGVVGFDDIADAASWRPALTTVATKPHQIGEDAANLLLHRIATPQGGPERVILPPRLVVRDSCGATTA